jgi:ribosomal-protein-alanine N-acetyltransferase
VAATLPSPPAASVGVKSIGPFDLGRLARLHRNCFEEPWSRSDLAHLLAMPGGGGLIARVFEKRLSALDAIRGVGFSLYRVVRDESELLSIGVSPMFRKRQVGTKLLRESMLRCFKDGARTMFLEVAIDNHPAIELYREHGFEEVGTRKDYYRHADGKRTHAYSMRCDLVKACCHQPRPLKAEQARQ